jgi:hypothetical protein
MAYITATSKADYNAYWETYEVPTIRPRNNRRFQRLQAAHDPGRRIISAFAKAVRSLESVKKTPCRLLIRTPALALQNGFWDRRATALIRSTRLRNATGRPSKSKKRESIPIISTVSVAG